jgi:transcriptional regulator with XRE-family HTH domain
MTGDELRELRERQGLTQTQLAFYLDVSETVVSKMEHGKRRISFADSELIKTVFQCLKQGIMPPRPSWQTQT